MKLPSFTKKPVFFCSLFAGTVLLSIICFITVSCRSVRIQVTLGQDTEIYIQSRNHISRTIYSRGIKSAKQLTNFFMDNNPQANKKSVKRLAELYVKEAKIEGINSDCAFVQMCLETGWLRFGNLVTKDMHNYCGLGSTDAQHPGERFATEQMGVRAHIQHLHAYATTADIHLKKPLVDPRYKYVQPRGKAPTIYQLAGTWAMDPNYSLKLDELLTKLEAY